MNIDYESKIRARLAELEPAHAEAKLRFLQIDTVVGELKTILGEMPERSARESAIPETKPSSEQGQ